ncbi:hypothetical protein Tco_1006846 [Tanacetum coccineum]|uniref:Reverse transcriptase domain-containing protein n=1 Tax=Tanacetum coccineum TaxID=301880 RepID=A0ABQ5FJ15_9ASTR
MSSSENPSSKLSKKPKISIRPVWKKKMNTCRSPNLNEVDTPTPMPKPPSPYNTPSKENSSIAPSNQASPQHRSPPLIDPYNQAQFLAIREDLSWVEFLLTRPQPPLQIQRVMDAPTIPVSAEENLRDPIDIRVDIISPEPWVPIEEEMGTLRFRMGMAEADNASLRGKIKTMEAIETVTRSQEKRARIKMERQKERIKLLRVRALVMTIGLDHPKQILNAHIEAQKPENLKHEDVGVRFSKRGKLNPRYVGPFQVLAKKCYAGEPLAVSLDGLNINDKLHFVEEQVEIMDREVKWLKQSRIPSVKVRWNSRRGPEFTWEREDQFRKKYPHLFTETAPSSSATS